MKEKLRNFWTLDRHHAAGFTLVELIVVIAILAILAGVAVPAYSGYIKKAEQAADEQLLAALNTAYAAACMENGEYDMRNITAFAPKAEISDAGVVTVNAECNEAFQQYFGAGNKFNHYEFLGFVASEGVFKGNTMAAIQQAFKEFWNKGEHSFTGKEGTLLGTFDQIGGIFENLVNLGFDGVNLDHFLNNFSDNLLAVTGLEQIFGDVNGAMNLTNEQLDKYLMSDPDYAKLTTEAEKLEWAYAHPEVIATIKGNVAVMQFAKDAAAATPEGVKKDLDAFVDMVNKADAMKDDQVDYEGYYLDYLKKNDPDRYDWYTDPKRRDDDKQDALKSFLDQENPIGLSGWEAAKWEAAAGTDVVNTSGTSTLGSLYALAAGYYASTGQQDKKVSTFDDVWAAMQSDGFNKYYEEKGAADIEAYITFMGALSGGDINMTDPDAFGGPNGMGGYISDLLK